MKSPKPLTIVLTGILIIQFLVGCGDKTITVMPDPGPNNELPADNDQTPTSADDDAANQWLKPYCTQLSQKVGDGECVRVARLLTDAPGYGTDANGNYLGGYDYIKLQQAKIRMTQEASEKDPQQAIESAFPTVSQYLTQNEKLKRCDNLVLTGPGYDDAGHTVVVFAVDEINDKLWYLEQNMPTGDPLRMEEKTFSEIEDIAYIIPANCKSTEMIACPAPTPDGSQALSLQQIDPELAQGNSATEEPDPNTSQSKISFISDNGEAFEVFVMNADGSNRTQLTDNHLMNVSPDWSPDGSKIAFLSGGVWIDMRILVMNSDGSNSQTLNEQLVCQDPSWSPDGKEIACAIPISDHETTIVVINVDAGNQTIIEEKQLGSQPDWSPDGQKIAFTSKLDGGNEGIFVMDSNGQNPVRLTSQSMVANSPAWSPDGTRIAFTLLSENSNWDIYIMNADGSSPINITNNLSSNRCPTWSPDGNKIAFVTDRDGNLEIYVINADGTNPVNITNNPMMDNDPSWSK